MGKTYIGIDPGKTGYITVFVEGSGYFFKSIETIGSEVDIKDLSDFLGQCTDVSMCVLEDVHAIFGSAASSTWEFGKVCGIIEAILVIHKIPFTKIQPKKWQKEMWEGIPIQQKPSSTKKTMQTDTKLMSELVAKRLFPDLDLRRNTDSTRSKKIDHNKVDSLLMCEYAKRKF